MRRPANLTTVATDWLNLLLNNDDTRPDYRLTYISVKKVGGYRSFRITFTDQKTASFKSELKMAGEIR